MTLLKQAQGTFDLEARRAIMAKLQQIMQARGPVGIAYWHNTWTATKPSIQGYHTHPSGYRLLQEVWIDPDPDVADETIYLPIISRH